MTNETEGTVREYDYEYLGYCMFEGFDGKLGYDGQPQSCGMEAIARIWWDDYDKAWLACAKHFEMVTGVSATPATVSPAPEGEAVKLLREQVEAMRDIRRTRRGDDWFKRASAFLARPVQDTGRDALVADLERIVALGRQLEQRSDKAGMLTDEVAAVLDRLRQLEPAAEEPKP